MSRYITTFVIFILTVSLTIYSSIYIKNHCKALNSLMEEAEYFIENSMYENAEAAVLEAVKTTRQKRAVLCVLTNHDIIDNLSNNLVRTLSLTKNKEKALALSEITVTREIIDAIFDAQLLTVENIF